MRRQMLFSLGAAALMIVAAFALHWLNRAGIIPGGPAEISRRGFNVILGLIVVSTANLAPKRMKPLKDMACEPGREQSARRFISLTIVLGGLAYALTWLAAPFDLAFTISMIALGGATAVAALRLLSLCLTRGPAQGV